MDKHSDELNRLMKDPENKACIDCGSTTQWASVNNSVFICLNCAGMHRGLGVNISFVRSVTMDKWEAKQIKLMCIGGNRRFKALIREFNIPNDIDIGTKYKLKVMDYYRKQLRAEAFGEDLPEKPDHISAFEQIETFKQFKEVSNANFISSQGNIQDNNSNHHKDEASFLYSVGTFFENRVNDLQNGIKDMKIKEKTGDFSKKAVNYMGEKTNEVINSYFVQSIFKKSKELFQGKTNERNEDQREPSFQSNLDINTNSDSNKDYPSNLIANHNVINKQNDQIYDQTFKTQSNKSDQNIYDFFSPPQTMKQNKQKEKEDLFKEIFCDETTTSIPLSSKEKKNKMKQQDTAEIPTDLFDK